MKGGNRLFMLAGLAVLLALAGCGRNMLLQGERAAVVHVRGFGGNIFSYRNVIPLLARDPRVIAVDLKGCGYSERDAHTGLSHRDQVAMLKGLLDKLGVERAAFVGHSLGGAVVQRFAATHPKMVDALVLVALARATAVGSISRLTSVFLLRPLVSALVGLTTAASYALQHSVAAQPTGRSPCGSCQAPAPALIYDATTLTDEVRRLTGLRIEARSPHLRLWRRSATTPSSARDHHAGAAAYAADDRAVAERRPPVVRQLPQAQLVVIDSAAHLLMEERPEGARG